MGYGRSKKNPEKLKVIHYRILAFRQITLDLWYIFTRENWRAQTSLPGNLLTAAIVQQQNAGPECDEHDRHADANPQPGGYPCTTFAATTHHHVRWNRDQQLQHTPGNEPAMQPHTYAGRIDVECDPNEND